MPRRSHLSAMIGLITVLVVGCTDVVLPGPGDQDPFPPLEEVSAEPVTTESGLTYYELEIGEGDLAERGMEVRVRYLLWLDDGTGLDRGTLRFVLGSSDFIDGFNEGVQGMREGGARRLVVPPELGYGEEGTEGIPGDATLVFDVELLEVRPRN